MGGGDLIITNFHKQRYESVKPLLEAQSYINSVSWLAEKPPVIDLDKFRDFAGHHKNLVEAHFLGQGLTPNNWRDGWLTVDDVTLVPGVKYSVINRTTNYADPNCDWKKEVDYLLTISDVVYFIGYPDEYTLFQSQFNTPAKFYSCDFLEAAQLIKKAQMFTGCYSAMSTIAMGLGINYRLEQAPGHTCSSLLGEREVIINA